jgi:PIN domain nuclease of toxin-antitoxin system
VNYLLDTHTFIWTLSEDEKLSDVARPIIENTNNSIFVSSVSFWEISLKFSTGKLKLSGFVPEEMPELSKKLGFEIITPTPNESASFHKLIITTHKDPFDRMLIWQAIQRDLVFISKDESLKQYKAAGLKLLW